MASESEWQRSACILCTCNCGIEVQLGGAEGREIVRTRGDEQHPLSEGYLCNKASRLNHYQNNRDRLTSPLRRRDDGSFEEIDWDTAISEIAARLGEVRDTWGGDRIFYYGGGGQGNHLPGAYSRSVLAPLGSHWHSNALAQEKTGEFWVASAMHGGYAHGDFEHCDVALFLGKNPWHSHGIHRARIVLREIAKDPNRTLIVIDPRRTETADMADIHLAVKPGKDAWLLAAMAATLVQENLINHSWVATHVSNADPVFEDLKKIPIAEFAQIAGIPETRVRETARLMARARGVATFEDLGVQMNRHSSLVSYLQRLCWLPLGHFGREGTMAVPNGLVGLGKGGADGGVNRSTPVTGSRVITNLVPCNVIADEILTDHPERFRAMLIESANPVHSLADSQQFREAMAALELTIVIDVAMTETAQCADYVLPASSQYEKAEATFFNFEFPNNVFHLRHPLFEPLPGTLSESEIHARLAEATGAIPAGLIDELNAVLDSEGRAAFRDKVMGLLATQPELMNVAPVVLYRTLGRTLPDGLAPAASLWALAMQHAMTSPDSIRAAGIEGEGLDLGDALFDAMVTSQSGLVFSTESWDDMWRRAVPSGSINLDVPELRAEMLTLIGDDSDITDSEYPFVLSAGERRAFTANTIFRDPDWRRKDRDGAMTINPDDAARLNLGEGASARVTTNRGSIDVVVELSDRMQRGHVSIPNGTGLDYPDANGVRQRVGPAPNELTSAELRDRFAGTPWHKSVPARIEAI